MTANPHDLARLVSAEQGWLFRGRPSVFIRERHDLGRATRVFL
jgi:hypothetical protein